MRYEGFELTHRTQVNAMATMTMGKVRAALGKTVSRVERRGERVVLRRRGQPVAALVPIKDLELIERLGDEIDNREADKALKESKRKGVRPLEDVLREIGL